MTMKRRTTGALPPLALNTWSELDEVDEEVEVKPSTKLQIKRFGDHQEHPLAKV